MRKATAFRGGANKTAPPCFPKAVNSNLVTVPAEQLQRNITLQKSLLLGKTVFHIRKKGVPPLLLPTSVLQLPLKPCSMLQPSDFEGNCDSSDFLLDFRCSFSYSFYLLRKCGLLAHTSPTFLKNCWIKKLLVACGLLPRNDISRENGLPHPAKGGSTPAFACQRAAIAPLPCSNLQS